MNYGIQDSGNENNTYIMLIQQILELLDPLFKTIHIWAVKLWKFTNARLIGQSFINRWEYLGTIWISVVPHHLHHEKLGDS